MRLTSNQRNWSVFLVATAVTGTIAATYLNLVGPSDDNIRYALRTSAHVAFVVLLVVFVARPLRQIVRTPTTKWLLQNRRLVGIAFAGIHTAHLGLVLFRDRQISEFNFSVSASLPGGLTYVMIYLMFLTSFDATARVLGPKNWRLLHKVGLYWILLAFLPTLLPESRDQLTGPNGALILLAAVAIVIRLTVYLANGRAS